MHPRIARRRDAIRKTDELVADMIEAAEEERRGMDLSRLEAPPDCSKLWIVLALVAGVWAGIMIGALDFLP